MHVELNIARWWFIEGSPWNGGWNCVYGYGFWEETVLELALCTAVQSCWSRKGPFPNCSHKVGSMKFSWYGEALRVSLTGTKGPCSSYSTKFYFLTPPNS